MFAVRCEVEQVVPNLKAHPQRPPETPDHFQFRCGRSRDQGTALARPASGIPPRLAHDHCVVLLAGRKVVLRDPTDIERLPLEGARHHGGEVSMHSQGEFWSKGFVIIKQGHVDEAVHRVPRVERKRNSVDAVQCGLPPSSVRAVLDVIVDERELVEQFQRNRRSQSVFWISVEEFAAEQQQCRTKALPAP